MKHLNEGMRGEDGIVNEKTSARGTNGRMRNGGMLKYIDKGTQTNDIGERVDEKISDTGRGMKRLNDR